MTVVASHGAFEVVRYEGAAPIYRLTKDGTALRWAAFAHELRTARDLRRAMIDSLAAAEHAAYFFECAPWLAGLDRRSSGCSCPRARSTSARPIPRRFASC
jgi:hypothetical protein